MNFPVAELDEIAKAERRERCAFCGNKVERVVGFRPSNQAAREKYGDNDRTRAWLVFGVCSACHDRGIDFDMVEKVLTAEKPYTAPGIQL